MDRWEGKVALVTGASAVIGSAIAKILVKHGVHVYAAAKRTDRLAKLAADAAVGPGMFHPLKCDMMNEADILAVFDVIKQKSDGVDILINNAGVLEPGSLTDGATCSWRRCLDTNMLGLCIATREAVKSMKDRNVDGHIIHVNSILGHGVPSCAGPYLSVYPASKNAVSALTESLRQEFVSKQSKIKISSLSPGLVETDIFDADELNSWTHLFGNVKILDPDDIAEAAVFILSTPQHSVVSELTIRPVAVP